VDYTKFGGSDDFDGIKVLYFSHVVLFELI